MTTRQILVRARKRIADRQAWVKNEQAFTRGGEPVDYDDPDACRWCAAAAIAVEAPTIEARFEAYKVLAAALNFKEPRRIVAWNNAKRRRHSEVMAAFDLAISKADA